MFEIPTLFNKYVKRCTESMSIRKFRCTGLYTVYMYGSKLVTVVFIHTRTTMHVHIIKISQTPVNHYGQT
jgi:hypothetical protein